jgi:Bacterial Ig domain
MNTYPKSSAVCGIMKSLLLVAALMGAGNAVALDVFLRAEKFTKILPDGLSVAMWGYALDSSATTADGVLSSPGPVITLPAGDGVLNVTLINKLPVHTSLILPGQSAAMNPVFTLADGTVCIVGAPVAPAADRDCRVRSFTKEAAPGTNSVVYNYTNAKPGTYLYQSGTSPQIQIQMGLYGAFKHDAPLTATKNAYPSIAYDQDLVLVYSEIDKAMHDAVDAGTFSGSTLNYDPQYFLVNGASYKASVAPTSLGVGTLNGVVLRLLNASLRTRVPTFSDGHWFVIAEDGNPYRNAKEQYTTFLPAGKTADVWFSPIAPRNNAATNVTYTVFDRRLGLTNNNADAVGGMFYKFAVSFVASNPILGAYSATPSSATQNITSTFTPNLSGGQSPFRYVLDIAPTGMTIDSATGVLTWKPTNEQARRPAAPGFSNDVTVRVTDANGRSDSRSFSVVVANVNDAPIAPVDSFDVYGGALTVAAKGVMRKAVDPDGDAISGLSVNKTGLAGTLVVTLAGGSAGAFTYVAVASTVPTVGYTTQQFTYTVSDGALTSNIGTVTLNIHANKPPVANNDRYTFSFVASPAVKNLDVRLNDTDTDGTTVANSVVVVDKPNNGGTATVKNNGTIDYRARVGFKGTETFTYTVRDNVGAVSNKAYVQVDTR